jgi:hypothetical protein
MRRHRPTVVRIASANGLARSTTIYFPKVAPRRAVYLFKTLIAAWFCLINEDAMTFATNDGHSHFHYTGKAG